jgi:hypothetical protein
MSFKRKKKRQLKKDKQKNNLLTQDFNDLLKKFRSHVSLRIKDIVNKEIIEKYIKLIFSENGNDDFKTIAKLAKEIQTENIVNKEILGDWGEPEEKDLCKILLFYQIIKEEKTKIFQQQHIQILLGENIFKYLLKTDNQGLGEPFAKNRTDPFHNLLYKALNVDSQSNYSRLSGSQSSSNDLESEGEKELDEEDENNQQVLSKNQLDLLNQVVDCYVYGVPANKNAGYSINSNIKKAAIILKLTYYFFGKYKPQYRIWALKKLAYIYFRGETNKSSVIDDFLAKKPHLQQSYIKSLRLILLACEETICNTKCEYNDNDIDILESCIFILALINKVPIKLDKKSQTVAKNQRVILRTLFKTFQQLKLNDVSKNSVEYLTVNYLFKSSMQNKPQENAPRNLAEICRTISKITANRKIFEKFYLINQDKNNFLNLSIYELKEQQRIVKNRKKRRNGFKLFVSRKPLEQAKLIVLGERIFTDDLCKEPNSTILINNLRDFTLLYFKKYVKEIVAKSQEKDTKQAIQSLISSYFIGLNIVESQFDQWNKIFNAKTVFSIISKKIKIIHKLISTQKTQNINKPLKMVKKVQGKFKQAIEEVNSKIQKAKKSRVNSKTKLRPVITSFVNIINLLNNLQKNYNNLRKKDIGAQDKTNYIDTFILDVTKQLQQIETQFKQDNKLKENVNEWGRLFGKRFEDGIFGILDKLITKFLLSDVANNTDSILAKLLCHVFLANRDGQHKQNFSLVEIEPQINIAIKLNLLDFNIMQLKKHALAKIKNQNNKDKFIQRCIEEEDSIANIIRVFAAFFEQAKKDIDKNFAKNVDIKLNFRRMAYDLLSFDIFSRGMAYKGSTKVPDNIINQHTLTCNRIFALAKEINRARQQNNSNSINVFSFVGKHIMNHFNIVELKPEHPLFKLYIDILKENAKEHEDDCLRMLIYRCFSIADKTKMPDGKTIQDKLNLVYQRKITKDQYSQEINQHLKSFKVLRYWLCDILSSRGEYEKIVIAIKALDKKVTDINAYIQVIKVAFEWYDSLQNKSEDKLLFLDELVRPILDLALKFLLAEKTTEIRNFIIRLCRYKQEGISIRRYKFKVDNIFLDIITFGERKKICTVPTDNKPWIENFEIKSKYIGSLMQNLYERAIVCGVQHAQSLTNDLRQYVLLPILRRVYLGLLKEIVDADPKLTLFRQVQQYFSKGIANNFEKDYEKDYKLISGLCERASKLQKGNGYKRSEWNKILLNKYKIILHEVQQCNFIIDKEDEVFWQEYSSIDLKDKKNKQPSKASLLHFTKLINIHNIAFPIKKIFERNDMLDFILRHIEGYNNKKLLYLALGTNTNSKLMRLVEKNLQRSKKLKQHQLYKKVADRYKLLYKIKKISIVELQILREYLFLSAILSSFSKETQKIWKFFTDVLPNMTNCKNEEENKVLLVKKLCNALSKTKNQDDYRLLFAALEEEIKGLVSKKGNTKQFTDIFSDHVKPIFVEIFLKQGIAQNKKHIAKKRSDINFILFYVSSANDAKNLLLKLQRNEKYKILLYQLDKRSRQVVCSIFHNATPMEQIKKHWEIMQDSATPENFMLLLLKVRQKYILLSDKDLKNRKLFISAFGHQIDSFLKSLHKLVEKDLFVFKLQFSFQQKLCDINNITLRKILEEQFKIKILPKIDYIYTHKNSFLLNQVKSNIKSDIKIKTILDQFIGQTLGSLKLDKLKGKEKNELRILQYKFKIQRSLSATSCQQITQLWKLLSKPVDGLHFLHFLQLAIYTVKSVTKNSFIFDKNNKPITKKQMKFIFNLLTTLIEKFAGFKKSNATIVDVVLSDITTNLQQYVDKYYGKQSLCYTLWKRFADIISEYKCNSKINLNTLLENKLTFNNNPINFSNYSEKLLRKMFPVSINRDYKGMRMKGFLGQKL